MAVSNLKKGRRGWIISAIVIMGGFVTMLVLYAQRPYSPPDFRFLRASIEPHLVTRSPPPHGDIAWITGVFRAPYSVMAREIDSELSAKGWRKQGMSDSWQNSDFEEITLLDGVLDWDAEGNPMHSNPGTLCSTVISLRPKSNWAQQALRFLHLVK